ncbi:uncharacterized protein LOC110371428 [Helicoverpa armigera]|uniref:uncharacterized protein LOC110371428 n=1 Tax=Helicoverpa armigera TaxID=29058 RepID=UPI000B390E5C|nr:uncharacterized protein LOC110371428 [Helicoverpa armigera]XP_047033022.1 uncharacterized protein LOC124639624 [Helicoverpa zea]PZC87179.1 hypothetical protein B5X24_HaOG201415 [Helicoverpa armigera]
MSSRVLLCDLCVILLYGLSFILAEEKSSTSTAPDDGPKGNCSCGGFPTSTIELGSLPLLSQTPGLVVKCDDEGAGTCKSLCNALATATKAKGPEVLCNRLKNAKELKLSAFYQICDKPWTYADLTADEPLCCEESKVKICPSMESVNSTDTVATMAI